MFKIVLDLPSVMNQKSQILMLAQRIFLTRGFKNVNMDDLAREMGISKKTLYQHFENKVDLIHQILEAYISQEKKTCTEILSSKYNPIQKLVNIQKHNYEMLRSLNPIALHELQRFFPQAWSIFEHYKTDFIFNQVRNNYQEGIELGYYRKDLKIDIVASIHVKSIDTLFKVGMENPDIHLGDIFKEYYNYHLRGISTEKGIKELNKVLV